MITSPFVHTEPQPYHPGQALQGNKMPLSTLFKKKFSQKIFHEIFQQDAAPKSHKENKKARPLIIIKRPKAF